MSTLYTSILFAVDDLKLVTNSATVNIEITQVINNFEMLSQFQGTFLFLLLRI